MYLTRPAAAPVLLPADEEVEVQEWAGGNGAARGEEGDADARAVSCVRFSPRGRLLATASLDGTVALLSTSSAPPPTTAPPPHLGLLARHGLLIIFPEIIPLKIMVEELELDSSMVASSVMMKTDDVK